MWQKHVDMHAMLITAQAMYISVDSTKGNDESLYH